MNNDAVKIAEKIRSEVNALQICHQNSLLSKFVTVSSGVSTIVPNIYLAHINLLKSVDKALEKAKIEGRDRVIFQEFTEYMAGVGSPKSLTPTNKL